MISGHQDHHQLRARSLPSVPRQHELPLRRLRALRIRHPPRLEIETLADRGQHLALAPLLIAARPRRQVAVDHRGLQPGSLPRPAVKNPCQGSARNS